MGLKIFHKFSLAFLTMMVFSCSDGIKDALDWEKWRNDPLGCNGSRLAAYENLESILPEIRELNANAIDDLLGSPDEKDLLERSQKEYKYFLSSSDCEEGSKEIYLWIRFGAIGNVSEILLIK